MQPSLDQTSTHQYIISFQRSGSKVWIKSFRKVWIGGLDRVWERGLIQTLHFEPQPYISTQSYIYTTRDISCNKTHPWFNISRSIPWSKSPLAARFATKSMDDGQPIETAMLWMQFSAINSRFGFWIFSFKLLTVGGMKLKMMEVPEPPPNRS